jgi:hypothetical protein
MNMQDRLQSLAAPDAAPPWNFDEFEQRSARAVARQRGALWSAAGSVAVLGLVLTLALITQPAQQVEIGARSSVEVEQVQQQSGEQQRSGAPALVDMSQFDVTSDLEDHIALIDAELSVARVYAAPVEQLRQMESTREQLNQSLQRVSYAHSLLSL